MGCRKPEEAETDWERAGRGWMKRRERGEQRWGGPGTRKGCCCCCWETDAADVTVAADGGEGEVGVCGCCRGWKSREGGAKDGAEEEARYMLPGRDWEHTKPLAAERSLSTAAAAAAPEGTAWTGAATGEDMAMG